MMNFVAGVAVALSCLALAQGRGIIGKVKTAERQYLGKI